MKWKSREPKHEDVKVVRRFLIIPFKYKYVWYWLEKVEIKLKYSGWHEKWIIKDLTIIK